MGIVEKMARARGTSGVVKTGLHGFERALLAGERVIGRALDRVQVKATLLDPDFEDRCRRSAKELANGARGLSGDEIRARLREAARTAGSQSPLSAS